MLPAETEVIVVGGGTAGAVVAARLAEAGVEVLVLEAGPDPGPLGDPHWPGDLVDATRLGTSCDWGFDSGTTYADQVVRFERARVIGGCSAHNGAVQTWGHRRDYDDWAAAGNAGWATDDLLPLFRQATERLRVRTYERAELTPWQAAWFDAAPAAGLPQLTDLNDLDETAGIAPESVNIVDGVRFNSSFAYLDPARGLAGPSGAEGASRQPSGAEGASSKLSIAGEALVDRLLIEGGRVTGVAVRHRGAPVEVHADLVILAGGTFCSPAVLLRSGVGPAAELRALGIPVARDLPGVGGNLHDQPFLMMTWEGSAEMARLMDERAKRGWAPDEQVLAKAASSFDPDVFDVHLLPYSPTHLGEGRRWQAGAACLLPRSRGQVTLADPDPETRPHIDHRFLTDEEGHDVAVLAEGAAMLREIASTPSLRAVLGPELTPGPDVTSADQVAAYLRSHIDSYWHPVGTCKMGPQTDPAAVVDQAGRVHGLDGCLVADCSIMPTIPRATTAMPAVVIGERIAQIILAARD